jgi:hypothetical protein
VGFAGVVRNGGLPGAVLSVLPRCAPLREHRRAAADRHGRLRLDGAAGRRAGVYLTAIAEQLTDPAAIEHGIGVFSRESVRQGDKEWGLDRVTGDARLRLYRASVHECSILDPDVPLDVRVDVRP